MKKYQRVTTPPYDTGKVKIGAAYVPRPRWDDSGDAFRIQSALLNKRSKSAFEFIHLYITALALAYTVAYIIM